MQALPYNQGLDAQAARGTIALAKQRFAPAATPSAPVATAHGAPTHSSNAATPVSASADGPPPEVDATAPAPEVEGAADIEIDDEEDEGPDAAAAVAARMASELAEVAALTGQPLEEDELLYAVPMCAPYDAMAKCKYRVKLVPGPQKKGKAARQALEVLCATPSCTARCAALVYFPYLPPKKKTQNIFLVLLCT